LEYQYRKVNRGRKDQNRKGRKLGDRNAKNFRRGNDHADERKLSQAG